MSKYQNSMNIIVPRILIEKNLEDHIVVTLLKIFSFNSQYIKVLDILSSSNVSREDLKKLTTLNLISIEEHEGNLCVNLEHFFTADVEKKEELISADFIDRIHFLLSRRLTPIESQKIQNWLDLGIMESDIELALQKTVLNGVDNLNYTETILKNNVQDADKSQNSSTNVVRNVDLY